MMSIKHQHQTFLISSPFYSYLQYVKKPIFTAEDLKRDTALTL